jgi:prepilin-type N-terminal cleavage/methylation domain-containing protein
MKKGFTITELLTTIAILVIIAGVTTLSLLNRRNTVDLKTTAQQMGGILREAQSDAMSQSQGVAWGVRFSNTTTTRPFFALFASSTFSTSSAQAYYFLPTSVNYATSTVASGSSTDVVFSQVSGVPTASTTITIISVASSTQSSTVTISASGAIIY